MSKTNPLQVLADQRFYTILTRAKERARVAPLSPEQFNQSERSSWSSASVVSSIDLKSPEPKIEHIQKTQPTIDKKLLIGLGIFIIILICIIIILSITLPLTLIKNPPMNDTTVNSSDTDTNRMGFSFISK